MSRSSDAALAVREHERHVGRMDDEQLRIFLLRYSKGYTQQPKEAQQQQDEDQQSSPTEVR